MTGGISNEEYFARQRVPGRFYLSRRYLYGAADGTPVESPSDPNVGRPARFAYEVFDSDDQMMFARENGCEVVLRETERARQQVKASFFEDDRQLYVLIIQRFLADGRPWQGKNAITLTGDEIARLKEFLDLIEITPLPESEGTRFDKDAIARLLDSPEAAQAVYAAGREEIFRLIENDVQARDVIAVKHRRRRVEQFEKLLDDEEYFRRCQAQLNKEKPEDLWEYFFEQHRWIFGFGLSGQVLLGSEGHKLETVVEGTTAWGSGKRTDALMQSGGLLSSLCLIEIKRPDTELLTRRYRTESWMPGKDVIGGIVQSQTTVEKVITKHQELVRRDNEGFPIGQLAYVVRPRSFLLVGHLREFLDSDGNVSVPKFRCFENFRRSLRDPEIITYDELLARAQQLLSMAEDT